MAEGARKTQLGLFLRWYYAPAARAAFVWGCGVEGWALMFDLSGLFKAAPCCCRLYARAQVAGSVHRSVSFAALRRLLGLRAEGSRCCPFRRRQLEAESNKYTDASTMHRQLHDTLTTHVCASLSLQIASLWRNCFMSPDQLLVSLPDLLRYSESQDSSSRSLTSLAHFFS